MRSRTGTSHYWKLAFAAVVWTAASGTYAESDRAGAEDPLLAGFRDPPKEARPATYWLWLNGYVNRDHIERELREFRDRGIGGVLIFDMGARGDRGAMPPAGPAFMSEESVELIAHAVRVAGRLGLDVQLSVASSWDMGGAWVAPRHGSMGLFGSETTIEGPIDYEGVLPFPPVPASAPRVADGQPAFFEDVAVLAFPADRRLPGHDFVFRLDPPGIHHLDHAVLYNTASGDQKKYGDLHLFAKDFALAVSTTTSADDSFREILRASLKPTTAPQRFAVQGEEARFVRLRLISGHNPRFDRIQLGEFELFDKRGVNVVASHVADRSRDGADLIRHGSALGEDRDWTAANIHDGSKSGPGGSWSSAGPPPVLIETRDSIVDLSHRLGKEGRLEWQVPAGRWSVVRLVCSNTGERLKVPSPNSDGLATDHLSRQATREFLDPLIRRLQARLGPLGDTALEQLYLASYEVRGRIWTPDLPARFRHYRGYDMTRYLPALFGATVASEEITRRFIYDYRKTLGDLLVDAYYRAAADAAHEAGVGIESEAGGPGPPIHQVPADALRALGAIDEVRGEFWPKRPEADALWVVKETACAAHIYGKRRVHMEAFTSMHHWQDGPFDLKPSADRAFCEGANHFVWHTASHSPPEAGEPGWVYLAGTHLSTKLVWWPKAKAFLDYLARCSFLLQQGLFVADVCYYYGDQGYNFVPPKHVHRPVEPGYDYDVTNREVILTRMAVQNGRITLPDGMSYALLVLPEREDMDLDVLRKLERLVREGATVLGPKPVRSNGLTGYPDRDRQVREVANRLWGPCDGKTVLEHEHGRGRIVWGQSGRDVLRGLGLGPDFTYESASDGAQLDFVHRRTRDADIYFVRNQRPRPERVEATFRVRGRAPEVWRPDAGHVSRQHVYAESSGGISMPLRLPPHGSVFIVFRSTVDPQPPLRVRPLDPSGDVSSLRVDRWDGHRTICTAFQGGTFRIQAADGRAARLPIENPPEPRELAGRWEVRFGEGPGAPPAITLDRLISWTEHSSDGVRYFSGEARYQRDFDVPDEWLETDRRLWLDLGDLWSVGEVYVNGRSLGILWSPPYEVEITSAVVRGHNTLAVEVANTWSNRLVGDAGLPASERLTRTNVTHSGGHPWKDVPLIRSGLFGPVRLVPARVVTAELR